MESYLLQSSIALALFYVLYRATVYRESNQQLKRLMGISIALFSSCFLLAPFPVAETAKDLPLAIQGTIDNVSALQSTLTFTPQKKMSIWLIIYLVGAGVFSLRFLAGLVGIAKLYLTSEVSRKWGFILVESKKIISPFSFFSFLFITKGEIEKPSLAPIILHEKYHKDQLHSIDAMILELLTILFWFNPFMWLLQRDVKASHEYLADDFVISTKGYDKLAYQDLLFEARTGISFKSANYLSNQTSLKQRFNMMEKRKTHSKTSFIRAGIVLVAMGVALFTTSFSPTSFSSGDSQLDIRIFTANGQVDLDKGIAKDTDKLFIRMVPREGEDLKYRVSKTELTLVVGGVGRGQLKAGEVISLEPAGLATLEEKSTLVLEVKEYQTMNTDNIVETHTPEKGIFFSIPVY